jgi:hypothetical protein
MLATINGQEEPKMECFKHKGIAGVGICKSCFKAICRECAIENEYGLACSESCALVIRENHEMNERAKGIYGIGNRKSKLPATGVIVWALLSLTFWCVAILPYFIAGTIDYGNITMAVLFTVITVVVFFGSKRTGIKC